MRRAIAPTTLATIFMTLFVLGTAPTAGAGVPRACSNARLRGSFGFTSQGALLAGVPPPVVGPFGEIGRQTFDGRGGTEGTATLSANGNILQVTFQGTYDVNPDCTGSMTFLVSPLGTLATLDFVIDDGGTEVRAIVTGAGVVETRVYRKQGSRGRED